MNLKELKGINFEPILLITSLMMYTNDLLGF